MQTILLSFLAYGLTKENTTDKIYLLATIVSMIGGVICILWFLMNRRHDVDIEVRYTQLNKLEEECINKHDDSDVSLSRDTIPVFTGEGERKDYLKDVQLGWSQLVPVCHILLWLPGIFISIYLVVGVGTLIEISSLSFLLIPDRFKA